MTAEQIIADYGPLAIFIGCFFEGETFAITGGVLAHRGLLTLWQVAAVAVCGAFCADTACFVIARHYRTSRFVTSLMGRPGVGRIMAQVDIHPRRLASLARFIPGMRILGPVALAQTRLPTAVYIGHASVSAVVWGLFYTLLGQSVAEIFRAVVGEGRAFFFASVAVLVCVLLGGHLIWRRWVRARTAD